MTPLLRINRLGFLGLFLAVTASTAWGLHAKPSRAEVPFLKFDLPPVPFVYRATRSQVVAVDLPGGAGARGALCGGSGTVFRLPFSCGSGRWEFPMVPPRESRLADPMAAMGEAYRHCRAMVAEVLETRISVEQYPEGYFGDLESEGMVRVKWGEVADEARLEQVFALLVEALGDEEPADYSANGLVGGTSARDIRWEAGLVPELAFEFVGELPLRVEVSLRQRRVLVLAGGKWNVYALDRRGFAGLDAWRTAGVTTKPRGH